MDSMESNASPHKVSAFKFQQLHLRDRLHLFSLQILNFTIGMPVWPRIVQGGIVHRLFRLGQLDGTVFAQLTGTISAPLKPFEIELKTIVRRNAWHSLVV